MFQPAVTIATIGDSSEGQYLRLMIERMGLDVHLTVLVGPDDLVMLLGRGKELPPVLILTGPADAHGFIFGGFDTDPAMRDDSITPAYLAGKIRLDGQLVISTAARSGQLAMAKAFMNGSAGAYLAPEAWPCPADTALFLHVFLHAFMVQDRDIEDAMEHAHGYADAFTLYLA